MSLFGFTFSYFDAILVALLCLTIYFGYKRGLVLMIVSLVRFVVGYSMCFSLSELFAKPVYLTFIKPVVIDYFHKNIVSADNLEQTINNLQGFVSRVPAGLFGDFDISTFDLVNIPEGADIASLILENTVEKNLISVVRLILFILLYIVFFVITGLILKGIVKLSRNRDMKRAARKKRKPLPKRVNQYFGAFLGFVKGAFYILAIASILGYYAGILDNGNSFYQAINDSFMIPLLKSVSPFNF